MFFTGLDLSDLGNIVAVHEDTEKDTGRKAFVLRKFLMDWQESFNVIEKVLTI